MSALRLGSLFAGYGGLSMAVQEAIGGQHRWFAEFEPASEKHPKPAQAAMRVLEHHWPNIPNLGDVRQDWSSVEEVDITDGGYPCPGESAAGKRLGMDDPRWMWPAYFDLIREMRPRLAIGENVRGHVSKSFRHVVADLQGIGYAAVWSVVAASDIGAPHERKRVFWLAYDEGLGAPACLDGGPFALLNGGLWRTPDLFGGSVDKWPAAGAAYAGAAYAGAAYAGAASTPSLLLRTPTAQLAINGGSQHPAKRKEGGHGPTLADEIEHLLPLFPTPTASDTNGPGHAEIRTTIAVMLPTPTAQDAENVGGTSQHNRNTRPLNAIAALLPTPKATDGEKGGPNQRGSSGDLTLPSAVQPERWGPFAEAVARWESITRPAPEPTITGRRGTPKLSPRFVEWMMGAPAGHFVDVPGVTVNQALKLGGNGVVIQQGAAAIQHLMLRVPASVLAVDAAA